MGNECCGSRSKAGVMLPRLAQSTNYQNFKIDLQQKVKDLFAENRSICFFESSVETINSNGIDFDIRMIKSLDKKPTVKDNEEKASPFLPPFEPDLFITDLSYTHNLIFNKFCICPEHCLVTTKKQDSQDSPLTEADWFSMTLTMLSLKAMVFFNRGQLSGFSVPHKHF